MDLLLRLLERRVLFSIVAGSILIFAGDKWGGRLLSRIDMMRHPPQARTETAAASPLAADIIKTNETRESAKLRGLHRAISAEIAAAAANGFKVDRLQRIADSALELDTPAYRSAAMERLNRMRLAIPLKKEPFRPAAADDLNPDVFDDARPKGKAKRR